MKNRMEHNPCEVSQVLIAELLQDCKKNNHIDRVQML